MTRLGESNSFSQPDDSETGKASLHTTARLDRWLKLLLEQKGSDLLLVPGAPASIRFEGEVRNLESEPIQGLEIEAAVLPALTPHALQRYRQGQIGDSSYRIHGVGRFRINLHHERGNAAAAIRALPSKIPSIRELNLPPGVESLARLRRGLVLVGGATGSGKSTTLAALIDEINRHEARHIITIEDPLEYEHTHIKSIVEQVEIGVDAPDFPTALRAALRQAPDIIVVGEMRDPETMRIAVAAAETGHLVFSTLHTTDVPSTVSRISDSFPPERQHTIRQELAMALAAVLVQTLLPSKNGGRVPAAELLMVGYGARQHIRRNALQHLHQEITMTKNKGSFTLEESLVQLVNRGLVEREDAQIHAIHPDDMTSLMKS
ncbi:MAG TPA: PilT/PilU family type 4a pilus ATPase [Terriglobales bacterium]|nr:PilT/PilU family type 4a pilus ATPase [Terriglobales bacterium]HXY15363.1 PilT/PilU family type 4a pilus ATPase [Terriglobales bacterium]